MHVLAGYNIKGGVGKTATSVNLSYQAAQTGLRVLLWDLDPQGAASFYFRVQPKVAGGAKGLVKAKHALADLVKATDYSNLDMVPADFSYRKMDVLLDDAKKPTQRLHKLLGELDGQYDVVVIDCPPSVSLVTENVVLAADALMVPLVPTTLSLRTYEQILAFQRKSDHGVLPLMPFFSMVDRRRKLHRDIVEAFPGDHPEALHTAIPYAAEIERMGIHRAPVAVSAPRGAAAKAYAALWAEIVARLGAPSLAPG